MNLRSRCRVGDANNGLNGKDFDEVDAAAAAAGAVELIEPNQCSGWQSLNWYETHSFRTSKTSLCLSLHPYWEHTLADRWAVTWANVKSYFTTDFEIHKIWPDERRPHCTHKNILRTKCCFSQTSNDERKKTFYFTRNDLMPATSTGWVGQSMESYTHTHGTHSAEHTDRCCEGSKCDASAHCTQWYRRRKEIWSGKTSDRHNHAHALCPGHFLLFFFHFSPN